MTQDGKVQSLEQMAEQWKAACRAWVRTSSGGDLMRAGDQVLLALQSLAGERDALRKDRDEAYERVLELQERLGINQRIIDTSASVESPSREETR